MIVTTLLLAMLVTQLVPADSRRSSPGGQSIPLVCDAQNGLTVPVSVGGAPPRPFVLDTGASITTIDERFAASRTPNETPSLPTSGGRIGRIPPPSGSEPVVLAQLTVGETALPAIPVVTANVKRLAGLPGNVGGILGSDALRAMGSVTLDYEHCRLIIGARIDESVERDVGAVRVPLDWHQGRPVIAVDGGGRLLLDSGATTIAIFTGSRAAGHLQWASGASSLVRIERVDGVKVGFLGRLACLSIGSLGLRDVPAVAVRSWYERADTRAPEGLLPPGLFARVHLAYDTRDAVLVPRSRSGS